MAITELRGQGEAELQTRLAEARAEVAQLRFQAANDQLKQVRQIRVQRRLIARLETLLREARRGAPAATVRQG